MGLRQRAGGRAEGGVKQQHATRCRRSARYGGQSAPEKQWLSACASDECCYTPARDHAYFALLSRALAPLRGRDLTAYLIVASLVISLLALGSQFEHPRLAVHPRGLAADLRGHGPTSARAGVQHPTGSGTLPNAVHLVALFALVLFCGLRYNVGTDYPTYRLIFRRLSTDDWVGALTGATQESGFVLLQLVIKTFTDEPAMLFLAASALTLIPTWVAIRRVMGPRIVMSWGLWIGLGFYLNSFNTVRQSIAVALLLLAATYLPTDKKRFVLLSLVASTFHITALIAAAGMFLSRHWRPTTRQVGLIIGGSVLLATVGLTALAPFVSVLNARYSDYITQGSETGMGAWLQVAVFSVILLASLVLGHDSTNADQQRYATWAIMAIGLMLIGTQAVILFRMSIYFKVFVILLVPMCIARSKRPSLYAAGLAVATAVYFMAHVMAYDDLLPYQSIL